MDGHLPVLAFPKRSSCSIGGLIRIETADPPFPVTYEFSEHMVKVFPSPRVLEAPVVGRKSSLLGGMALMQNNYLALTCQPQLNIKKVNLRRVAAVDLLYRLAGAADNNMQPADPAAAQLPAAAFSAPVGFKAGWAKALGANSALRLKCAGATDFPGLGHSPDQLINGQPGYVQAKASAQAEVQFWSADNFSARYIVGIKCSLAKQVVVAQGTDVANRTELYTKWRCGDGTRVGLGVGFDQHLRPSTMLDITIPSSTLWSCAGQQWQRLKGVASWPIRKLRRQ